MSVPASLVTGFLGSGKTTLLNRVLREPAFTRSVVIVNEFGEIALDHLFIETPSETTVLLDNGCICCTVRGELVDTLLTLAHRRGRGELPPFDRVLVETTGLADPVPIVQSLVADASVAPHYRAGSVTVLVDAVNGPAQLDAYAEAVKQVALADRILVTKCDLAGEVRAVALERRLGRLNPAAARRRVLHGKLPAAELADTAPESDPVRWLNIAAFSARERPGKDGIRAFSFFVDLPVRRCGMVAWLTLLAGMRGSSLLRVKGLLNVEGEPVAVHAVQSVIHEPATLARWPDAERRSRLVFITRGMTRAEVERTLGALQYDGRDSFDSDGYARFVAMARSFR
jgi:G3E family GTPase